MPITRIFCSSHFGSTGAVGHTTTTDPRSRRNRVGRRGGQLLTRAHGSSYGSACPLTCSREEISRGIAAAQSARLLGRSPSTVSRELNRNGGYDRYRAALAETSRPSRWPVGLRSKVTKQLHPILLLGKHMLDTRADFRFRIVGPPHRLGHSAAFRLLVRDMADESILV